MSHWVILYNFLVDVFTLTLAFGVWVMLVLDGLNWMENRRKGKSRKIQL